MVGLAVVLQYWVVVLVLVGLVLQLVGLVLQVEWVLQVVDLVVVHFVWVELFVVHFVWVELVVLLQLQWDVLHSHGQEVLDNCSSCAQVRDKLNISFYDHLASFGCYLL